MGENLPDLPGRVWTGAPRLRVVTLGGSSQAVQGHAELCRCVLGSAGPWGQGGDS